MKRMSCLLTLRQPFAFVGKQATLNMRHIWPKSMSVMKITCESRLKMQRTIRMLCLIYGYLDQKWYVTVYSLLSCVSIEHTSGGDKSGSLWKSNVTEFASRNHSTSYRSLHIHWPIDGGTRRRTYFCSSKAACCSCFLSFLSGSS